MKTKMIHCISSSMRWCAILLTMAVFITFSSQLAPPAMAQADDTCITYRVVFVKNNDTLNVRSGPGAASPVVGVLTPSVRGIRITGEKTIIGDSSWYPISAGEITGWVMSRYLTRDIEGGLFCRSNPVDFLQKLLDAVRLKSGDRLASMVDSERGLRLYLDPWSKGLLLTAAQLPSIFSDTAKSTWGVNPDEYPVNEGTFAENVLPLMQHDLLQHTLITCNEMNHPQASEPHTLPPGSNGINFISFFRSPGPDQDIQDWGEWVVGVEKWNGRFVLSYLAHYKWTP